MKTTFISKENNDVKFKIEFTAEEFEKEVNKVYNKEKAKIRIDGFRPGKAPRGIIEKKYGKGIFREEAIDNILQLNYPLAIDELDLEPIDQPRIEFGGMNEEEGLDVTITVACYPEFDVTGYEGVEIEEIIPEVTDEDVDNEVESVAKRNARIVEVERPVQDGDMVTIDYEGWCEGEQFEGGTAEGYPLKIGSGTFIPGFEEQLVGASTGDDVEVKVTFPEEYHSEELAGKEATFKCKVHEIKEEQIPEIDDEFVKDISEFDTLEEYKADTKAKLEEAAAHRAETQMKSAALRAAMDANPIDIPAAMIETEIDSMLQEFNSQLSAQGMSLDLYLQYTGMKVEDFRNDIREEAETKTKTRMVVGKIVEKEDFEVTDEDVEAELVAMAAQYGMELDKVKEAMGGANIDYLKGDLKSRKAIDYIYEKAVKVAAKKDDAE